MNNAPFDLAALLHPAQAFSHPRDVVHDRDLTLNEKRAILASWASDACAVAPAATGRPRASQVVGFDDVIEALRTLDDEAAHRGARPHYRGVIQAGRLRRAGGSSRRG